MYRSDVRFMCDLAHVSTGPWTPFVSFCAHAHFYGTRRSLSKLGCSLEVLHRGLRCSSAAPDVKEPSAPRSAFKGFPIGLPLSCAFTGGISLMQLTSRNATSFYREKDQAGKSATPRTLRLMQMCTHPKEKISPLQAQLSPYIDANVH